MRKYALVFVVFIAAVAFSIGCGGGGGTESSSDIAVEGAPEEQQAAGNEALADGDIESARTYYCAAKSGGGAEAHFGCALANMLLLIEREPVTNFLAGFGQAPWTTDSLFGTGGYLARLYEASNPDDVDVTISGAVDEHVIRPQVMARYGDAYESSPHYDAIGFSARISSVKSLHDQPIRIRVYQEIIPLNGAIVSGVCAINEGDTVTTDDVCIVNDGAQDHVVSMMEVKLYDDDYNYTTYNDPPGSITVNAFDWGSDAGPSVTFNDLVLEDVGGTIALNGSFTAKSELGGVSTVTRDGIPFQDLCPYGGCLLSQVAEGYRSSEIAESLDGLQSYLDEITADLEVAVADEAVSFYVPKEMIFTYEDVHISHSDMLGMLAGLYAVKAGINFANSWTVDVELSGIVDANGKVIIDKQLVVDQLNESFVLRGDHQLDDAHDNLVASFVYAKQAVEAVISGAQDGLMESNGYTSQFYYEVYELLADASASVGGITAMSTLDPAIGVNLASVFNGSVDGANIMTDPFVLEYNRIKPVESYFSQLMGSACSYSLSNPQKVKVFSDGVRAVRRLAKKAFANATRIMIGGHDIHDGYIENMWK